MGIVTPSWTRTIVSVRDGRILQLSYYRSHRLVILNSASWSPGAWIATKSAKTEERDSARIPKHQLVRGLQVDCIVVKGKTGEQRPRE